MIASNHSPILIVDDDRDLAESLSIALEGRGYQVSVAYSGEEALEQALETDFDICFLDVRLPGMNGVDCFLRMQQHRPGAKVVLMTGYRAPDLMDSAMERGAVDIMDKPLNMDKFFKLAEHTKRVCIFVADDDRDFREELARLLGSRNYRVVLLPDGRQILERAREDNCAALILDLRMPGVDGIEVKDALERSDLEIPIVILSAFIDDYAAELSKLDSGQVVAHLRKPVDPELLLSLVNQSTSRD